jgi:glycosyltransferase involved in cell wall biosynthesis
MSAATPVRDVDVSVVIPCRNEEANASAIAAAVIAELERLDVIFDIIFIDNASSDNTVEVIRSLCDRDPRIKLIVNTRNFGQMRSPTHAVFEARGRAVIGMCADFQDPPELLGQFVERWRAGVDIVLGVRESEKSSLVLGWIRELSYAFARRIGDYPIIRNATGFGLYDQRVVRTIAAMKEPEPFFRGMLVETGYALETIPYARPRRSRGLSNNNFFTLLDFALSGLASSSKKLLRLPFFLAVLVMVASGSSAVMALVALASGGGAMPWFVAAGIELQLGLIFLFLGLIGDQVRLVSERTRGTPLVIERERINFPDEY